MTVPFVTYPPLCHEAIELTVQLKDYVEKGCSNRLTRTSLLQHAFESTCLTAVLAEAISWLCGWALFAEGAIDHDQRIRDHSLRVGAIALGIEQNMPPELEELAGLLRRIRALYRRIERLDRHSDIAVRAMKLSQQ